VAKKTGLGKGLTALIGETTDEAQVSSSPEGAVELDIARIHRNPDQPRVCFDEQELDELADSIAQFGVLQPIMVRPDDHGYMIVAGERRYQAAQKAGRTTIPAVVREADDAASLEIALIENIQRSDLNSIEEARAYRDLMSRTGLTQEALAKRISKSRSAVANTLRLLDLPEEVQEMVLKGDLTAGHARAILSVATDAMRVRLAQKVVDEKLTVRQTESLAALFSVEQADKTPRSKLPTSFKRYARQLRQEFDRNVKIKQVRGLYRVEIEFTDENDLETLVAQLKNK
jgi:ParB family chromosome partitioning protein